VQVTNVLVGVSVPVRSGRDRDGAGASDCAQLSAGRRFPLTLCGKSQLQNAEGEGSAGVPPADFPGISVTFTGGTPALLY